MKDRKIDEIDKKILYLLSENARISYVDMANEVSLSRVAVKTRIENLEKSGIIKKYTTDLNLRNSGKDLAVYFELKVKPVKLYEIGKKLAQMEFVTDVYQMSGTGKLHMHALLDENKELNEFLEKELYAIDGVVQVTTSIILTRFKARVGAKL